LVPWIRSLIWILNLRWSDKLAFKNRLFVLKGRSCPSLQALEIHQFMTSDQAITCWLNCRPIWILMAGIHIHSPIQLIDRINEVYESYFDEEDEHIHKPFGNQLPKFVEHSSF